MLSRLAVTRLLAVALALCAATVLTQAQSPKNAHKRDVRMEVEKIDHQWQQAELSNDIAAMERLLSDDYIGVTASGRVVTKAQQLDRMRTRRSEFRKLQFSDLKVKLLAGGAASVTSTTQLDATMDGNPMHGEFRSIRVYERSGGVWKLVNFEATRVRGGEPGGDSTGR